MKRLLFVTDPLCSWCWGTLPEVFKIIEQLPDDISIDLIMGGMQIGPSEGLVSYDKKRLRRLWHEVEATTGQQFSGKIPERFRYHSELACRSVEIARRQKNGDPPFRYFHTLQQAFYRDGLDINRTDVLAQLLNLAPEDVHQQLHSPEIVEQTRDNFQLAKTLAATALPIFLLDSGHGYKLVCGGYITAEFLLSDLQSRI